MFPIDVVITEVNDLDQKWFEDFNKYKKLELEEGLNYIDTVDDQAFGEQRFRDWHTLKYWFRGIDTCCSWVNKVFLIVRDEKQVPDWLDRNCSKLRLVYHTEFIPNELLPTFNANTITAFIPKISDLSEHYIYFDNDCYIINNTPINKFFSSDGKPKYRNVIIDENISYIERLGNWGYNVENTYNLEKKYGSGNTRYQVDHLFKVQLKSIGLKTLNDNYDTIYNGLKISRFRRHENIVSTILINNVTKRLGLCEFDNTSFDNCRYASITKNINFEDFKNYQMICLNDIGGDYNFEEYREKLLKFFANKFPNKCIFEK